MDKEIYKITGIPSSFVFGDMKLLADKGAGEAKLFAGPKRKEDELDQFFQFESGIRYRFDRTNLLEYMLQVKMEYVFQTINKYKVANEMKWNELYSMLKELKDTEMYISLNKFVDSSRYYIRADEELFKKTFRKIVIPKLTDLLFIKDVVNNEIVLRLNVNYEYERNIEEGTEMITYRTGLVSDFERNRILFGAPGTGKSYTVNKDKDLLLQAGGIYERVTFHPDYTYANFVGTYKPVPCKDSEGEDAITYEYVPGPFMRTLVRALKNGQEGNEKVKPHLLIIEEINRANVAAVFGDVFQLLDRDHNEVSEYPIQASEDMKKYLARELNLSMEECSVVKIPDNMFIWATMNSADQGVFPMDTAFKRRWDFTYLGIDSSEDGIVGKKVVLGTGEYRRIVEWNALRKAINKELLKFKVNEDKLMGPYFISKKNLGEGTDIDTKKFTRIFKNKVLMYLFDDAAKQKRPSLFAGCEEKNLYSSICDEFDEKGVHIFCEDIHNKFIDMPEEG